MDAEKPKSGTLILGAFPAQVEATIKERVGHCMHMAYELDEEARIVRCRQCGVDVDAFTVLRDYARGERMWRDYTRETKKERELLAELQAEERKVKARTRSASRKDAETAVTDERRRAFEKFRSACWRLRQIVDLAEQAQKQLNPDNLMIPIAIPPPPEVKR